MDKSALDIVMDNRAARDAEKPTEAEVIQKEKRPLSVRLLGVELLAERWPHNPMQMNYDAMGITSEELE